MATPSHAFGIPVFPSSPGCSTFYMALCLTWQVNGSCSSFVFHFVPCFPAVPLDEMVNQRGFSMEIHRNPMRFGHFLPKFAASCAASEDTIQEEGVDILRLDQAGQMQRWGFLGFPWHSLIKIAMEELENMSFCIFYHIQKMPDDGHIRFFLGSDGSHCTRSTMDCNREIVELTLLGAYSEILSCSRKWRAAAARLGRNQ